jgi:RNA 3'-terminal phosphate cyclase (ATP)
LCAPRPTNITLEGGTHNPHAPPLDFLEHAFLPIINRMGPQVSVALERAGFYPAGGGRVFVHVQPTPTLAPITIDSRGKTTRRLAKAVIAALPGDIAIRELKRVEKMLGWSGDELQIRQLPDDQGPGNILTLMIQSEYVTEVFTGFGMKGVTADAVAQNATHAARQYFAANVPIGECLADQLLIPFALSGAGGFMTQQLTRHALTNIQVIEQFLSIQITTGQSTKSGVRVSFGARL